MIYYILEVNTTSFNDGTTYSWSEPDSGLGCLKKTTNGWMIYGNQLRANAWINTGHNTTEGDDHYFFRIRTTSSLEISSVTCSGPNIPVTTLTTDSVYGGFKAFVTPSTLPPVNTEYTFTVNFADGTQQILYDTIKAYVATCPTITTKIEGETVTINWTDVSASVPDASYYWVIVSDNGVSWDMDELPLARTSVVFNEDNTAVGELESGKTYTVTIDIFNSNDDYAYRISSFTMP